MIGIWNRYTGWGLRNPVAFVVSTTAALTLLAYFGILVCARPARPSPSPACPVPAAATTQVVPTPFVSLLTTPELVVPEATSPSPTLASTPPALPGDSPTTGGGRAYYANCAAARQAGAAPIYRGEPGYRPALDRDNDGVACE